MAFSKKHFAIYFLATIAFSLTLTFNQCSKARFSKVESQSGSGVAEEDGVVVSIGDGTEIDEETLPECEFQDPDFPTACLLFKDSFERDKIVNHENFHWETVLMDNSNNTSNVDVEIADSNFLGPVAKGDKAILFRGREGTSSDHEVFLVSAPFDLKGYDYVVVQYKYLPIDLEDYIKLTKTGIETVEGPRVDFCTGSDRACGLTKDSDRHERLRDPANWESYYPQYVSGKENNIRNYTADKWVMHQVRVDLKDLPEERRSKVVFKISVAMDEGFDRNDRNRMMDDGLILDDVVFAVVKSSK